MASRSAKFTLGAIAAIALGAAAYSIDRSERAVAQHRATLRAFDLDARKTLDAIGNARASQQAYVAAGQGVAFWTARVTTSVDSAGNIIGTLRQIAETNDARNGLMEAAASLTELTNIDKRAREYLQTNEPLMASDVIFTEGAETTVAAERQVESARNAEQQAFDRFEGEQRKIEAAASAGAGGVALLIIVVLAFADPAIAGDEVQVRVSNMPLPDEPHLEALRSAHKAEHSGAPGDSEVTEPSHGSIKALKATAELCTELGRASDGDALKALVARAADVMDASGLIVWLGNATGADLLAVLAHGYAPPTLARIAAVPRSADNAAAAAYRSGALQIVAAPSNSSAGALVVPLLSPDGCIGALAVEIKGGGESSDTIQSLASIVAAQLSLVLAPSASETVEAADAQPLAAGSR